MVHRVAGAVITRQLMEDSVMVKMSAVDELEHLEARARAFVHQNKKLAACKVFIKAQYSTAYALAQVNRMFAELPSYKQLESDLAAALVRAQAAEGEAARLRDILALTPIHDKVLVVHETYQDSDGQCPHCRCDSDEPHKEACPVFSLSSYVDSLG